MTHPRYTTPQAFKQALEQRLRATSVTGIDIERRRQLLVFDRFLARVNAAEGDAVILKGGLVLELRSARARTTKDVDLRMMGTHAELLVRLQAAGRADLQDFLRFEVQRDRHHPDIRSEGMKYAGYRFTAECRLAGKPYGRPFGVDVAFGDPLVGAPDEVVGDDLLSFAGIEPARLRLYPVVSHIAEKLHAYTLPRTRPNSRIKDLPDLALLANVGTLDAQTLRTALERTFAFRATHPLPIALPPPAIDWSAPYRAMAQTDELPWPDLAAVTAAASTFLDPILIGTVHEGTWQPTSWRWLTTRR
ncbi:MAG: nucleotidyl transferase AbiEii/AbiGii toxin family protein [Planctomycetes bacterium]|nr:nucleotidyl transferase AbiEii/AbiGii toxin family protein [Planctomycetota bacterium]